MLSRSARHSRSTYRPTIPRNADRNRKFADSSLEGTGFENSVPLGDRLRFAHDPVGVTLADGGRWIRNFRFNVSASSFVAARRSVACESFWLTEHHFQPEGAEMSPNPLMVQMSVAAHTKRIRLGQAANIIVWHHPVRLAEQIATLDVISGGRVECGIGRGYQPRENETLGRPYGSTIQDQDRHPKT